MVPISPRIVLAATLGMQLAKLINLYGILIFVRIILSYFPMNPGGPLASISGVLFALTEPVLGPLRRTLPSFGMLDISPIVAFIGLQLLAGVVAGL